MPAGHEQRQVVDGTRSARSALLARRRRPWSRGGTRRSRRVFRQRSTGRWSEGLLGWAMSADWHAHGDAVGRCVVNGTARIYGSVSSRSCAISKPSCRNARPAARRIRQRGERGAVQREAHPALYLPARVDRRARQAARDPARATAGRRGRAAAIESSPGENPSVIEASSARGTDHGHVEVVAPAGDRQRASFVRARPRQQSSANANQRASDRQQRDVGGERLAGAKRMVGQVRGKRIASESPPWIPAAPTASRRPQPRRVDRAGRRAGSTTWAAAALPSRHVGEGDRRRVEAQFRAHPGRRPCAGDLRTDQRPSVAVPEERRLAKAGAASGRAVRPTAETSNAAWCSCRRASTRSPGATGPKKARRSVGPVACCRGQSRVARVAGVSRQGPVRRAGGAAPAR